MFVLLDFHLTSFLLLNSYSQDDTPIMCFNPAKNWQLGWYDGARENVNPASTGTRAFTMNGVDDYDGENGGTVVLRLEQVGGIVNQRDYYVGYNRATGM